MIRREVHAQPNVDLRSDDDGSEGVDVELETRGLRVLAAHRPDGARSREITRDHGRSREIAGDHGRLGGCGSSPLIELRSREIARELGSSHGRSREISGGARTS